jgi:hypothetical protein
LFQLADSLPGRFRLRPSDGSNWIVTTLFGFIVAVLDVIGLAIIDVPPLRHVGGAGIRHELHSKHWLRLLVDSAGPRRSARRGIIGWTTINGMLARLTRGGAVCQVLVRMTSCWVARVIAT